METKKVIFTKETEIPLDKIWLKIKSPFARKPKVKLTNNYNWDNTIKPQNPETFYTGQFNYPFAVTGTWESNELVNGEFPKNVLVSGMCFRTGKFYDESKNKN